MRSLRRPSHFLHTREKPMTKQILLQVRMHDETRILDSEQALLVDLGRMAATMYTAITGGPQPSVEVVELVDADQVDIGKVTSLHKSKS